MALSYVEQLANEGSLTSWKFAALAPFISAALFCVRMVVSQFCAEDLKDEALSDPVLIAFLSGEIPKLAAKQVVDVVLQSLICKAEVDFSNARTLTVAEGAPREETSVIETAVLNQLRLSQGSAEQLEIPEIDICRENLVQRRLVHDDETLRWHRAWVLRPLRAVLLGNAFAAALTAFAGALLEQLKAPNAINYVHVAVGSAPAGLVLYSGLRLADVFIELVATPLRTRAGDGMLERLKQGYEHLTPFRWSREALPVSCAELMLITAVFGLRSLPDAAFRAAPLLKELRSPERVVIGGT